MKSALTANCQGVRCEADKFIDEQFLLRYRHSRGDNEPLDQGWFVGVHFKTLFLTLKFLVTTASKVEII